MYAVMWQRTGEIWLDIEGVFVSENPNQPQILQPTPPQLHWIDGELVLKDKNPHQVTSSHVHTLKLMSEDPIVCVDDGLPHYGLIHKDDLNISLEVYLRIPQFNSCFVQESVSLTHYSHHAQVGAFGTLNTIFPYLGGLAQIDRGGLLGNSVYHSMIALDDTFMLPLGSFDSLLCEVIGYTENENQEIIVDLIIQNQRDKPLYFSLVDPSCFGENSLFKPFINQEKWTYDHLHKAWMVSLEIQAHQKLEISYSYRKDQ
jgi:hypothetical protein